jgi:very-short-patch-repair endonuclease
MKCENKALAQAMRREPTHAEKALWRQIRSRKLAGLKFRRQQPYGRYILDFYCPESKLAVELDGGQHDAPGTRDYDEARTKFLQEAGVRILRFWNSQVWDNLPWVLECIRREADTPHPNPLPKGAREKSEGRTPHPSPLPQGARERSELPLPSGERVGVRVSSQGEPPSPTGYGGPRRVG